MNIVLATDESEIEVVASGLPLRHAGDGRHSAQRTHRKWRSFHQCRTCERGPLGPSSVRKTPSTRNWRTVPVVTWLSLPLRLVANGVTRTWVSWLSRLLLAIRMRRSCCNIPRSWRGGADGPACWRCLAAVRLRLPWSLGGQRWMELTVWILTWPICSSRERRLTTLCFRAWLHNHRVMIAACSFLPSIFWPHYVSTTITPNKFEHMSHNPSHFVPSHFTFVQHFASPRRPRHASPSHILKTPSSPTQFRVLLERFHHRLSVQSFFKSFWSTQHTHHLAMTSHWISPNFSWSSSDVHICWDMSSHFLRSQQRDDVWDCSATFDQHERAKIFTGFCFRRKNPEKFGGCKNFHQQEISGEKITMGQFQGRVCVNFLFFLQQIMYVWAVKWMARCGENWFKRKRQSQQIIPIHSFFSLFHVSRERWSRRDENNTSSTIHDLNI